MTSVDVELGLTALAAMLSPTTLMFSVLTLCELRARCDVAGHSGTDHRTEQKRAGHRLPSSASGLLVDDELRRSA